MKNINSVNLVEPKLFDVFTTEFSQKSKAALSWIDHSFGRAVKLEERQSGSIVRFPAIYIGNGINYQNLLPNADLGVFSFWSVNDPQSVLNPNAVSIDYSADFTIWFDYRLIYPTDWEARTIDNVKFQLLYYFRNEGFDSVNKITVNSVYERSENIYKGYTIDETKQQFLMRPYCGLRINMDIKLSQNNCL